MFKSTIILVIMFVTTTAFAQDRSSVETKPWTLASFIALWQSVADEVARQDKAFSDSVDETTATIETRKNEIRQVLSEARKDLKARRIDGFIAKMNQVERQIKNLHREFDVSVVSEVRAYNRLLSIAAGQYSSYQQKETQTWVPETL